MKYFAIVVFISLYAISFAQNRMNIWELGYSTNINYPNCEMRYVNGVMDTNKLFRIMSLLDTNSGLSDTSGNLLFYSNGLTICNKNHDTLQNAVNFNPGWTTDFYEPDGMGIDQAILFLPFPGSSKKYYVFSLSGELIQNDIQPIHLSYSIIDMNLDGGLGGIVDSLKNKYAIEDTLTNGGLSAVKHGNGVDWWVIIHKYSSDTYYKFLITPNGIQQPIIQNIGSKITQDIIVSATFSPDGSKFCYSNAGGTFDFMEFDRCSGEFFNHVSVNSIDSVPFTGCSFSASSRFLYVSTFTDLYQFDTWDSDMINNQIHIAAWDSFVDPIYHIPIFFYMHQLAPDNRIYLSTWNGSIYFNVINSPDNLGLACNFEPHSYVLPQYNGSIPSFPNYDLEALFGSTCDTVFTLNLVNNVETNSFKISPNPTIGVLNILYDTKEDCQLTLYNVRGKQIASISLFHYFKNRLLNVSDLAAGVYLATVTCKAERIWSAKVIVQR